MSTELPIRIQTAEAIGWTNCYKRPDGPWFGRPPGESDPTVIKEVPLFDTTWCQTGDLLTVFNISLKRERGQDVVKTSEEDQGTVRDYEGWKASMLVKADVYGFFAESPLEAICRLIVRVKGK